MNGIKMSDCKFYINKEERTVVCVIPHTALMLNDFIYEHFKFKDFDVGEALWRSDLSYRMPPSFMGKAVCAEGDKWNEELGKMIAFSRAKDKCYKSFFRRANTLVNKVDFRLNNMIETLNALGMKLEDKRIGLEQRINETLDK